MVKIQGNLSLPFKELKTIFHILSEYGQSRLVGGCVRDILMGKNPLDIDVATQVTPDIVMTTLKAYGIQVIPTGIKHGTITAVLNHKKFEITTLRKDIENHGRHATVQFTDCWEEDAQRRDFTINAMYLELDGNLYDYFDGKKDLKKRIVRFVGNANLRVQEDYLRILRFFRFIAYYGSKDIDNHSLNACKKNLAGLDKISGERINAEMIKILSAIHVKEALQLMANINLFSHIHFHNIKESAFKNFKFTNDYIVNLAALISVCKLTEKEFISIVNRWKMSNIQKTILKILCFNQEDKEYNLSLALDSKAYLYKYGLEIYNYRIALFKVMNGKAAYKIRNWLVPKFPVNGRDIKHLHGKAISTALKSLEKLWIQSNFKFTKEKLLESINQ